MRYVSTRGEAPVLGFEEAMLTGLARDGGLYVPETIPQQGDVWGVRYTGCAGGAENANVVLYTIEDGGHTWPSGWPSWARCATFATRITAPRARSPGRWNARWPRSRRFWGYTPHR